MLLRCIPFWKIQEVESKEEEYFDGLRVTYYSEDSLNKIVEACFDVLEIKKYTEMEENDCIYVIFRKKE